MGLRRTSFVEDQYLIAGNMDWLRKFADEQNASVGILQTFAPAPTPDPTLAPIAPTIYPNVGEVYEYSGGLYKNVKLFTVIEVDPDNDSIKVRADNGMEDNISLKNFTPYFTKVEDEAVENQFPEDKNIESAEEVQEINNIDSFKNSFQELYSLFENIENGNEYKKLLRFQNDFTEVKNVLNNYNELKKHILHAKSIIDTFKMPEKKAQNRLFENIRNKSWMPTTFTTPEEKKRRQQDLNPELKDRAMEALSGFVNILSSKIAPSVKEFFEKSKDAYGDPEFQDQNSVKRVIQSLSAAQKTLESMNLPDPSATAQGDPQEKLQNQIDATEMSRDVNDTATSGVSRLPKSTAPSTTSVPTAPSASPAPSGAAVDTKNNNAPAKPTVPAATPETTVPEEDIDSFKSNLISEISRIIDYIKINSKFETSKLVASLNEAIKISNSIQEIAPVVAPAQLPVPTSAQPSAQPPAQTSVQTPAQTPAQPSVQTPAQPPAQPSVQTPEPEVKTPKKLKAQPPSTIGGTPTSRGKTKKEKASGQKQISLAPISESLRWIKI